MGSIGNQKGSLRSVASSFLFHVRLIRAPSVGMTRRRNIFPDPYDTLHFMAKKLSSHLRPFLEYLEIEKGRSGLTVRNYSFYIQRFLDWAKDPAADDVTNEDIRQYRLYLNRKDDGRGGTLKKSTQNYHLIALRSFLKYLAKNDVKTFASEKIELAKQ